MLSAGVAHEINNPLAYIANNLAVLERDVRLAPGPGGHLRAGPTTCWPARARASWPRSTARTRNATSPTSRRTSDKILDEHAPGRQAGGRDRPQPPRVRPARPRRRRPGRHPRGPRLGHRDDPGPAPAPADHRSSEHGRAPLVVGVARAAQPGLPQPAGQRHAGDRGDPPRGRPDRHRHAAPTART